MGLRQERFTPSSELVRSRLAELVRERQHLRDQQASEVLLERNRLEIVRGQQELARALVSEHAAASAA